MKKVFNYLLVILLVLTLIGCKKEAPKIQLSDISSVKINQNYQISWDKVNNAEYYELLIGGNKVKVVDNFDDIENYLTDGKNYVAVIAKSFNDQYLDSNPYVLRVDYESLAPEDFKSQVANLLSPYVKDETSEKIVTFLSEVEEKSELTNQDAYNLIKAIIDLMTLKDKETLQADLDNIYALSEKKDAVVDYLYNIIFTLVSNNTSNDDQIPITMILNNAESEFKKFFATLIDTIIVTYVDVYDATIVYDENKSLSSLITLYNSVLDILLVKDALTKEDLELVTTLVSLIGFYVSYTSDKVVSNIVSVVASYILLHIDCITQYNHILFEKIKIGENNIINYLATHSLKEINIANYQDYLSDLFTSMKTSDINQDVLKESYEAIVNNGYYLSLINSILTLGGIESGMTAEDGDLIDNYEYDGNNTPFKLLTTIISHYDINNETLAYLYEYFLEKIITNAITEDNYEQYETIANKYIDIFNYETLTYQDILEATIDFSDLPDQVNEYYEKITTYLESTNLNLQVNTTFKDLVKNILQAILDKTLDYHVITD